MEHYVIPLTITGIALIAVGRAEEGMAVLCATFGVTAYNGLVFTARKLFRFGQ